MNGVVASLDGREDIVPFAFDICAICVEPGLQTGFGQNAFAHRDLAGDRDSNSHRDDAQISNNFHFNSPVSDHIEMDECGGAPLLTRVMASLLFGVSATDAVTFSTVAVIMGTAAFAATVIPAHRATTVDPMVALREE